MTVYRGDIAGAARDPESLDLAELRRLAGVVDRLGHEMKPSAPPEISAQFNTVLAAIASSAANLDSGPAEGVVRPLFAEENLPAFEAVDRYPCPPAEQ